MKTKKKLNIIKELKKQLSKSYSQEGIPIEVRSTYKGIVIGPNNYNEFNVHTKIPVDATKEEIRRIRKQDKIESNRIRSLAKKHMKAFFRGKTQFRFGNKIEEGIKVPNIIKVTSNEFRLHNKV